MYPDVKHLFQPDEAFWQTVNLGNFFSRSNLQNQAFALCPLFQLVTPWGFEGAICLPHIKKYILSWVKSSAVPVEQLLRPAFVTRNSILIDNTM